MARKTRERAPTAAAEPRPASPESPDPVVLFSGDGRVLGANEAARNAGTPPPGGEPQAKAPPFWTNENGRTALLTAVRERRTVVNMEVRHPSGEATRVHWLSAYRIAPIAEGRCVGVARAVTE